MNMLVAATKTLVILGLAFCMAGFIHSAANLVKTARGKNETKDRH